MISSPGIGSGLDINSIVSQLMQIERRPLDALERQEQKYDAQVSAYGKVKSALSTFQSAANDLSDVSKFKVFSAESSNESVLTAKADSTVSPGSYSLNVAQLAQSHQLYSGAYADASTTVVNAAAGTLDITLGANPAFTVDIAAGSTLTDIRDAINEDADNTGVTASIITDAAGSRLVLSSNETGSANTISIASTGDVGLQAFDSANMTELQAAQDAQFTLGTLSMTSASNKVEGAIQGVTLDLKGVGTSTLTVARDTDSVQESVQAFVDAYNALMKTLNEQREGDLKGDSTLLSMESSIRNVLNSPTSGIDSAFNYLSEVGIETDRKDGTLKLDTTDLSSALEKDFAGVAELFANNDQGVLYRMDALVDDLLATNGLVDTRLDGIDARKDALQARMDQMEIRLELTEKRYRDQFTSLDVLLGEMNATSASLSQQLASLPHA